jgi:hypothetical protein
VMGALFMRHCHGPRRPRCGRDSWPGRWRA